MNLQMYNRDLGLRIIKKKLPTRISQSVGTYPKLKKTVRDKKKRSSYFVLVSPLSPSVVIQRK